MLSSSSSGSNSSASTSNPHGHDHIPAMTDGTITAVSYDSPLPPPQFQQLYYPPSQSLSKSRGYGFSANFMVKMHLDHSLQMVSLLLMGTATKGITTTEVGTTIEITMALEAGVIILEIN